MNDQGSQPPRRGAEESMDAAARRLREEMQTALRHLRKQVWGWDAHPGRQRDAGGGFRSPHE